ncbi:MAG: hypothetical protein ACRC2H_03765 [Silanimonas sp.]
MTTRSFTPHAASSAPPFQRKAESSRTLTSEHIDAHLAAFAAAGGKVEVLATTTVLKRIQAEPTPAAPTAAPSGDSTA